MAIHQSLQEDDNVMVYGELLEDAMEFFLSVEDWYEQVQINLGPNVEDITTKCKPPRRGRFTLIHIEAHEDKRRWRSTSKA